MQTDSHSRWPIIALIAIVAATLIRPGDAPWIYDEPLIMELALQYNATPAHFAGISLHFTPSPYGLLGTRGARYGPLAVWIDQILLAISHNPIAILAIRAALVTSITAIALYWLSRSLRVTPWLAVAVMLSPWLWFYSRQLWDNSLAIPLSALLFASYADFLTTRQPWSLRLTALCAMLLLLIHFMAIPLIAAIAIHMMIFESRSLWRFKWSMIAIIAPIAALSAPYWIYLTHHYQWQIPGGTSAWRGWFFPLFCPHHLTAIGLENVLGQDWQNTAPAHIRPILRPAQFFTLIAYPAGWIGILLAIPHICQRKNASDQILAIALTTLLLQCIEDGAQHAYEGPHYYNATWIIAVPFAWLAAQKLHQHLKTIATTLLIAYATSMLIVISTIAITIAQNAGARSPNYGTTISNQISAIKQIQQFSPDSPRQINFPEWHDHPHTPAILQDLLAPISSPRPTRHLTIQYRNATPTDASIEVHAR